MLNRCECCLKEDHERKRGGAARDDKLPGSNAENRGREIIL